MVEHLPQFQRIIMLLIIIKEVGGIQVETISFQGVLDLVSKNTLILESSMTQALEFMAWIFMWFLNVRDTTSQSEKGPSPV